MRLASVRPLKEKGDNLNNDEIILRKLIIKTFHIKEVEITESIVIQNGVLNFSLSIIDKLLTESPAVKEIKIEIIKPSDHDIWTDSIMDIIPVSAKVLGTLGEGITHTLTGAYVMLTGSDENGVQVAEFGSSEGKLNEQLRLNMAGTPSSSDHIIRFGVKLFEGKATDRDAVTQCHKACDEFISEIRKALKKLDGKSFTEKHIFYDKSRKNKYKVAVVKQIAGQGAMYDNQILPNEPSGFSGGRSIIDMGNVPIILTPNEYRDGAIRAMT